jgi:hydrogenase maturation factor/phosphoglycolate phosphatase-like HAD superfamily hydrolase
MRRIKAVLFDFDGTLTIPGHLDFHTIREEIGCPKEISVLDYINSLSDAEAKIQAWEILHRHELIGAGKARVNMGVRELLDFLKDRKVPMGIVTRNSRISFETALKNFPWPWEQYFDLVLTRDDDVPVKPSPEPVFHAADFFGVLPEEITIVGDYIHDIESGKASGAITVFYDNGITSIHQPTEADFTIYAIADLKEVLLPFLPFRQGKIPNEMLKNLLPEISLPDPEIIVEAGVGEDAAVINPPEGEYLVIASDPITFTTGDPGWYSVIVNANDIAVTGAVPRWLQTTILLPPGTTMNEVRELFRSISKSCKEAEIIPTGGHTEITDAVTRPVISGTIIGSVKKGKLIQKKNMREGDILFISKQIALEGTAILATVMRKELEDLGVAAGTLNRAVKFSQEISILPEARAIIKIPGISAMHDVTEGGIATAVRELAIAGGNCITVNIDSLPVHPVTVEICGALGIDPLGLIGSGALLFCCAPGISLKVQSAAEKEGIEITEIGLVGTPGTAAYARKRGKEVEMPCFETDELARFIECREDCIRS